MSCCLLELSYKPQVTLWEGLLQFLSISQQSITASKTRACTVIPRTVNIATNPTVSHGWGRDLQESPQSLLVLGAQPLYPSHEQNSGRPAVPRHQPPAFHHQSWFGLSTMNVALVGLIWLMSVNIALTLRWRKTSELGLGWGQSGGMWPSLACQSILGHSQCVSFPWKKKKFILSVNI